MIETSNLHYSESTYQHNRGNVPDYNQYKSQEEKPHE